MWITTNDYQGGLGDLGTLVDLATPISPSWTFTSPDAFRPITSPVIGHYSRLNISNNRTSSVTFPGSTPIERLSEYTEGFSSFSLSLNTYVIDFSGLETFTAYIDSEVREIPLIHKVYKFSENSISNASILFHSRYYDINLTNIPIKNTFVRSSERNEFILFL
jgi:hypothetical protein